MTSAFSWQNSASLCLLRFVFQGQICLLLQVSLDFPTFAFQSPMMKRTSFLGVSSRRSCRSLQNHSTSASSALVVGAQTWIYCDIECFALETNRDHSVIFEIAPQYCISDSFVDYDSYSISSKEFLRHRSGYNGHLNYIHPFQSILVSLIARMCMFTLVISCLTTSSLT